MIFIVIIFFFLRLSTVHEDVLEFVWVMVKGWKDFGPILAKILSKDERNASFS